MGVLATARASGGRKITVEQSSVSVRLVTRLLQFLAKQVEQQNVK